MVQANENGTGHNPRVFSHRVAVPSSHDYRTSPLIGNAGSKAAVWLSAIVVAHPLTNYLAKMPLAQGYKEIQALTSHGTDQPFTIGIRLGRLRWRAQHSNPNPLTNSSSKSSEKIESRS